jgi:hypothetical protein
MFMLGIIIAGLGVLGSFDFFDETFVNFMKMGSEIFSSIGSVVGRNFEL